MQEVESQTRMKKAKTFLRKNACKKIFFLHFEFMSFCASVAICPMKKRNAAIFVYLKPHSIVRFSYSQINIQQLRQLNYPAVLLPAWPSIPNQPMCKSKRGTTMNNHQAKATRKSTHHSRSHHRQHRQHRQTCFTGNGQKIDLPPPSELLRAFPGSHEQSFVFKMRSRRFLLFNCWTKPRFCRILLVETMNGPFLLIYQHEKTNNKNKQRRGRSFSLVNAQSVRIIRGKMITNVISSEQSHCLLEIQFKFAIVLIDLDGEERIAKWSSIFLKAFEPKLMPPPKPLPRISSATSLKSSPQEKEEYAKEVPLPQINISPLPTQTAIWHMQLASHRDQEEEHAEEEKEDEDHPKKNVENSLEEDLGSSQPTEDSGYFKNLLQKEEEEGTPNHNESKPSKKKERNKKKGKKGWRRQSTFVYVSDDSTIPEDDQNSLEDVIGAPLASSSLFELNGSSSTNKDKGDSSGSGSSSPASSSQSSSSSEPPKEERNRRTRHFKWNPSKTIGLEQRRQSRHPRRQTMVLNYGGNRSAIPEPSTSRQHQRQPSPKLAQGRSGILDSLIKHRQKYRQGEEVNDICCTTSANNNAVQVPIPTTGEFNVLKPYKLKSTASSFQGFIVRQYGFRGCETTGSAADFGIKTGSNNNDIQLTKIKHLFEERITAYLQEKSEPAISNMTRKDHPMSATAPPPPPPMAFPFNNKKKMIGNTSSDGRVRFASRIQENSESNV